MLHIHLYRARKRYRALVAAIAREASGRRPDAERLAALRAQRDAAHAKAAEIELSMAMTMGGAAPA